MAAASGGNEEDETKSVSANSVDVHGSTCNVYSNLTLTAYYSKSTGPRRVYTANRSPPPSLQHQLRCFPFDDTFRCDTSFPRLLRVALRGRE